MALGKVGGNQLETTLNIDSGTLYVDGTNNRIGINTQNPGSTLEVAGAIQATGNAITVSDAGFNSRINLFNTGSGGSNFSLYSTMSSFGQGANTFMLYSPSATAGIIKANVNGYVTMPYQPAFGARSTSQKTVSTNTNVLICDSAYLNVGNHYSTTTGKFTAPVSGVYWIMHEGLLEAGEDDNVDIRFYVNGTKAEISSDYVESDVSTGYRKTRMIAVVSLSANDTIDVRPQNNGVYTWYGDNSAGAGHTQFKGFLIG